MVETNTSSFRILLDSLCCTSNGCQNLPDKMPVSMHCVGWPVDNFERAAESLNRAPFEWQAAEACGSASGATSFDVMVQDCGELPKKSAAGASACLSAAPATGRRSLATAAAGRHAELGFGRCVAGTRIKAPLPARCAPLLASHTYSRHTHAHCHSSLLVLLKST